MMKKYSTPEIEVLCLDYDIVTFSIGSLEDMFDADGSPIQNTDGGKWGW